MRLTTFSHSHVSTAPFIKVVPNEYLRLANIVNVKVWCLAAQEEGISSSSGNRNLNGCCNSMKINNCHLVHQLSCERCAGVMY